MTITNRSVMDALARLEAAYTAATGAWTGADWHHERRDAYGVVYDALDPLDPVYCDGRTACATCAAAAASAHAAEVAADFALSAAREGDWATAVVAAEAAVRIERQWGDAPTWGPFARAVAAARAALDDAPDVPDDDDEDDEVMS